MDDFNFPLAVTKVIESVAILDGSSTIALLVLFSASASDAIHGLPPHVRTQVTSEIRSSIIEMLARATDKEKEAIQNLLDSLSIYSDTQPHPHDVEDYLELNMN